MIRLLQWLFLGHTHEWETMDSVALKWTNDMGGNGICERKLLRCKTCGNWKKKDLR